MTGTRTVTRATASNIRDTIKTIVAARPPPWKIWPENKPYGTAEDYCQRITGHSWTWLLATVAELTDDKELLKRTMMVRNAEAQVEARGAWEASE